MKKILIVKIAAIGDVVMALSMVKAIRNKFGSESEIFWICGKQSAPILRKFFNVNIIEIDEQKILKGNFVCKVIEVLKLWWKIAFKRFNLIATVHSDWKYRLLTLPVIANERRSWNNFNKRRHPIPGRYHGHEAIMLITGQDNSNVDKILLPKLCIDKFDILLNKSKPNIILVPGGAKNFLADDACRRWPLANYVELAKKLLKLNCNVTIVGSRSDAWVNSSFADLFINNLIGKTDIISLLEILAQADIVVTHDTGILHLSKLVSPKVFAIFGPTNPYEKIEESEQTVIFWKPQKLYCCPCYDGKKYADCNNNICMSSITPDDVIEKINDILVRQEE